MLSPTVKILLLFATNLFNVFYILSHVRGALSPRPSSSPKEEYCEQRTSVCIPLSAKSATAYRGHDFPEHLPLPFEIEMVPVTIEESVHYPAVGAPSNQEWLSIASPSIGYIRLGPEDRTFVISMFHELHCLRMINGAFSKMKGANVGHIKHCLNYVRQGVLCNPDLTLEPGNFEERDFEVERLGGTHLCKNWNPIYEWVDNNFETWANKTGWDPHPGHDKEAHVS
ncbi:hypothetical protein C8Q74DRAFT_1366397 [Fomes fomentarius]|nr:hypothetical protein C8Q74DRAFT_1366397 [Fomes fomentarius]